MVRAQRTASTSLCTSRCACAQACRTCENDRCSCRSSKRWPSRMNSNPTTFDWCTIQCKRTICTSSRRRAMARRSLAACRAWPFASRSVSMRCCKGAEPFFRSATMLGHCGRLARSAWRWPMCCSTGATIGVNARRCSRRGARMRVARRANSTVGARLPASKCPRRSVTSCALVDPSYWRCCGANTA